jgi:hypothetical protein
MTVRSGVRALLVVSALTAASPAHAQNLFSNPIDGTNPSTDNPFTSGQVVAPYVTVSGIGRGTGINANSGSNRYNATAWNLSGLDSSDYFT